MDNEFLENTTFAELTLGQKASLNRSLTQNDIELFAAMSGDVNPAHVNPDFAKSDVFHGVVGHGMWTGSLISTLLGTVLPGPGTIYLEQELHFKHPVRLDDTLTLTVVVQEKGEHNRVLLACTGVNQKGDVVIDGLAKVIAPTEKKRIKKTEIPQIDIHTHDHFNKIIESCNTLEPMNTAIVHPVTANVLEAVADSVQAGLIAPVLIGPQDKINSAAKHADIDISQWQLIDAEHSDAAAVKAVELAANGAVDAIMKGALHTDELMAAVVPAVAGLRTKYRISHVYVMDVPTYHKPLMITDAAINIAPTLLDKADICQNAINLWRVLYGDKTLPKLAILAAVEVINAKMQPTLDAAVLCKMADRGQISNGILDGPLAFDNAISKQAAKDKGIESEVAGDADILVVPEIESGNMLAKQLSFLGHADAAGIVLGARVPIILASRADSLRTRLLSCAVAVQINAARKAGMIK